MSKATMLSTMMNILLFVMALEVTRVTTSSCDDSLTLTNDTIRKLQSKMLNNGTDKRALLRLFVNQTSLLHDQMKYDLDTYDTVLGTSWIFARDSRAVYLLQVSESAATATTMLFGFYEYVDVDLNSRCLFTKDDVITFFTSGIWIVLKPISGEILSFEYMCVKGYEVNNGFLKCWYKNGTATDFYALHGIQTIVSIIALLMILSSPLILTVFTESGIYKDYDDDECFGLNIHPFPIGIRYCLLFWKPPVKSLRHIVYTLRILIIVLTSITVSIFSRNVDFLGNVPLRGPRAYKLGLTATFSQAAFDFSRLVGFPTLALLVYSSVMSFYTSIYFTTGPQDNVLQNRSSPSNGYRLFNNTENTYIFQSLLKIPKMKTSQLSDFTDGYKVWLYSIFDRKEFASLLYDRDISRPKRSILNVVWLLHFLLNVVILSPLVLFVSWILNASLDFFHTRASRCVKYVSLVSFSITVMAAIITAISLRPVSHYFSLLIILPSGVCIFHFLTMVILSILKKYFGSHLVVKQILDCVYSFMYAFFHLSFMAILIIFWIPIMIENLTFLILTPFCILAAVILYPEDTSYSLFVVVIMSYVILKPISGFTDQYSNLFRRIIRLGQEIEKDEKQLRIIHSRLNNEPNDFNTSAVSQADEADETSENNSFRRNEPNICVIDRHLTVQPETEEYTDQQDVRRSLITCASSVETSDIQEQRMEDIDEPYVKSRIFWELVKKYKLFPSSIVRMLLNICVPSTILICGYQILKWVGDKESVTKLQQLVGATLFTLGLPIVNIIVHSNEAEQRREGTMNFRLRRDIIRLLRSPGANV